MILPENFHQIVNENKATNSTNYLIDFEPVINEENSAYFDNFDWEMTKANEQEFEFKL